jgi:hypothetical protein
LSATFLLRNRRGVVCVLGYPAKSLSTRSACAALQKLVQRVRGCEDWPSGNRRYDGEKQRFDYKFPTLFAGEIAPAYWRNDLKTNDRLYWRLSLMLTIVSRVPLCSGLFTVITFIIRVR